MKKLALKKTAGKTRGSGHKQAKKKSLNDNVFSLRLSPELTKFVRSKVSHSKKESDVIRDAIQHYFDHFKGEPPKKNINIEAAKKSMISYRILESLTKHIVGNENDLLDRAVAKGLQEYRNLFET